MIKEIKKVREINSLIRCFSKNSTPFPQTDYYGIDSRVYIQVSNYVLSEIIFIHVESFPFYDKKVHTIVMNYLSNYINYEVKIWGKTENRCINIDELC